MINREKLEDSSYLTFIIVILLALMSYGDGSLRESDSSGIIGLNVLTPAKPSGVEVNKIDFVLEGASGGITSIRSDIYLENKWATPSDNMNLIVNAKQAESNFFADKKASETGVIAGDVTSVKSVKLDVPEGYNYMIEVELWKGDILVNTWKEALMLAPTKTVSNEGQEKKTDKYAPQMRQEPGFEAIVAIAALILAIALRRRS